MERNGVVIRPARRDDVPAIFDLLELSFDGYREFSPPDWEPPRHAPEDPEQMAQAFERPDVWYVVAVDPSGLAGVCGFVQAHAERWFQGDAIDGLAHFWQLFVRPDMFGTGLADRLHGMALDEIRERGFERARLWTPEGQARARAFYERREWYLSGERMDETGAFKIPLVQYLNDL